MTQPAISRSAEALAFALVLPAFAFGIISFNLFSIVVVAGIALLHALILGLPLFLLLRLKGMVNVFTSTASGLATGAIPAAILFRDAPGQALPFAAFGVVSGFIFGAYLWLRDWHEVRHASSR